MTQFLESISKTSEYGCILDEVRHGMSPQFQDSLRFSLKRQILQGGNFCCFVSLLCPARAQYAQGLFPADKVPEWDRAKIFRKKQTKGSPFLECVVFYGLGIAKIASDPPLSQTGNHGKKCTKPSWQAFTSPLTGNAHMETTHFKN